MISNELTEKLINEIKDTTNLYKYINKYDCDFPLMTFQNYIELIIQKKNFKKADIIKKSGLHRTFAYQMFSGKRKPSRDAALLIAYALDSNLNEAQKLLQLSQHNPLTPKNKRDAIIIFAFINSISLDNTNELLYENSESLIK